MRLLVFLYNHLVDHAVLRWYHVALLVNALLHVGLVVVSRGRLIRIIWLRA